MTLEFASCPVISGSSGPETALRLSASLKYQESRGDGRLRGAKVLEEGGV